MGFSFPKGFRVISSNSEGVFSSLSEEKSRRADQCYALRVIREGPMKSWVAAVLLLFLCGSAAIRADGSDPREANFRFFVDGAQIDGVVGYRIEFALVPVTKTGNRRLDAPYEPSQRVLFITVTQKGLNRLQDWLNGTTSTEAPASKTVQIQALDNKSNLLASWELTTVAPSTFSSAAAGNINEVDSTVEFTFNHLRLIQASGK
jgi:hypothetical protein